MTEKYQSGFLFLHRAMKDSVSYPIYIKGAASLREAPFRVRAPRVRTAPSLRP